VLAALAAATGLVTGIAPAPQWLPAPPPGLPTALVEREGRVLLGTDRGLYREDESGWALVLTRGGVRDVAPGANELLVATAAGLYAWSAGAAEPVPVRLGAGARVHSVAVDARGTGWAGSEVGLFARPAGERAFERDPSVPAGEVFGVRAAGDDVWSASRGVLRVRRAQGPFEIALQQLDEGWWELRDAVQTSLGTVLAVPRGLWLVAAEPRRMELGVGDVSGLLLEGDVLWVAASHGLYRVPVGRLEERALEATLPTGAADVALGAGRLLAATRRGVASFARTGAAPAVSGFERSAPRAGEIELVQRAALRYLELAPSHVARIEARSRGAAWLPRLVAGASSDSDRARARLRDQSFTSGDVRDLVDHDSQHGSTLELEVQLVWDLVRLASPDDAIAISKERRELIELRDQVLDRVNRLYFERLRVLARLDALPAERGGERGELELRARELAAGLDAWTGGEFARIAAGAAR
jgi:ligand-binding sensor domain-containing protein